MFQSFRDWRYALMWGPVGMVASVILHLLPEPFHVPFDWVYPVGWATVTFIFWILVRRGNRK